MFKGKTYRGHVFGTVIGIAMLVLMLAGEAGALSNSGGGTWQYYRNITINNTGNSLNDYQVLINLTGTDFPTNANASGADIRFTDFSGAELNYWIEVWDYANKSARVWVNVTNIPVGVINISMWYGNPSTLDSSNGDATFEFFDDFSGSAIDTAKWNTTDNLTQTGGYLYGFTNAEQWKWARSKHSFGANNILEYSINISGNVGGQGTGYHGFYDSIAGNPPPTAVCYPYNCDPSLATALTASIKHIGFGEGWCGDWYMCAEEADGVNREGVNTGATLNNNWDFVQVKWYGSGSSLYARRSDGWTYSGTLSSYPPTGANMNVFFGINDNSAAWGDWMYWEPVSMQVYWVHVRKYASSEPSINVGTEIGPSITVISPNGGENWQRGTTQTIKWSYTGNPGAYVKIELLKSGKVSRTIISKYPIGSGGISTYDWKISPKQALGTDYQIRITSSNAYTDTSDGNFAIVAPGTRAKGIDVSAYQHPCDKYDKTGTKCISYKSINWSKVNDSGKIFAWVKATELNKTLVKYQNPFLRKDIENGTKAGLFMGAYHFARPYWDGHTPEVEAEYFISVAKDYLKDGYLRPALDFENRAKNENPCQIKNKQYIKLAGADNASDWVNKWMQYVYDKTGVVPLIYTNLQGPVTCLDKSVTVYDLWVSNPKTNPNPDTDFPKTGIWNGKWDFWQYEIKPLDGIPSKNVDLDVLNGSTFDTGKYIIKNSKIQ